MSLFNLFKREYGASDVIDDFYRVSQIILGNYLDPLELGSEDRFHSDYHTINEILSKEELINYIKDANTIYPIGNGDISYMSTGKETKVIFEEIFVNVFYFIKSIILHDLERNIYEEDIEMTPEMVDEVSAWANKIFLSLDSIKITLMDIIDYAVNKKNGVTLDHIEYNDDTFYFKFNMERLYKKLLWFEFCIIAKESTESESSSYKINSKGYNPYFSDYMELYNILPKTFDEDGNYVGDETVDIPMMTASGIESLIFNTIEFLDSDVFDIIWDKWRETTAKFGSKRIQSFKDCKDVNDVLALVENADVHKFSTLDISYNEFNKDKFESNDEEERNDKSQEEPADE